MMTTTTTPLSVKNIKNKKVHQDDDKLADNEMGIDTEENSTSSIFFGKKLEQIEEKLKELNQSLWKTSNSYNDLTESKNQSNHKKSRIVISENKSIKTSTKVHQNGMQNELADDAKEDGDESNEQEEIISKRKKEEVHLYNIDMLNFTDTLNKLLSLDTFKRKLEDISRKRLMLKGQIEKASQVMLNENTISQPTSVENVNDPLKPTATATNSALTTSAVTFGKQYNSNLKSNSARWAQQLQAIGSNISPARLSSNTSSGWFNLCICISILVK